MPEEKTPYLNHARFFEFLPVALYRATPAGRIIWANPAMVRTLGCGSMDELLGIHTPELYADRKVREKWRQMMRESGLVADFEWQMQRADGRRSWVRENARADCDDGGRIIAYEGSLEDITGKKQLRESLGERARVLDAINRVFSEAMTRGTEQEVAATCLSVAEEMTQSRFGFLGELNANGRLDTLAIGDASRRACLLHESRAPAMIRDMPVRGMWGRVIAGGRSLLANDPQNHPHSIGTPAGHISLTAFLGVPLAQDGKTTGLIGLANKDGGYTENDRENTEQLSLAFSKALQMKRTEAERSRVCSH
ncbi:MAG: GAF domain-containing protein [Desulfobacteraceae bacterium]|nr:GAF domain-containing protein [Desulfobacteraceae bacterium]